MSSINTNSKRFNSNLTMIMNSIVRIMSIILIELIRKAGKNKLIAHSSSIDSIKIYLNADNDTIRL